jgi:hypothetical protein
MRRTALIIALLLCLSGSTEAQSPAPAGGRYQMLNIQANPNAIGARVLVLDTQEGDLWKWFEYGGYPLSAESGSAIEYLGKFKPGNKAGDVIERLVNPKPEARPATPKR